MVQSSNRAELEKGRKKLHSAYTGEALITDDEETEQLESLIRLAQEDELHDLSKMLQHLLDS